ncbi:uncharacterized protein LOC122246585 [Penaeus japonicus]|uniref:uncharacterized protein LOC122246585 n=1 Tax=Penaeus japonicus TaxID=27405 RepID=UPI001C7171A3|nr:uncharacterized protein LOC122246585 [Penaeus japonicus]
MLARVAIDSLLNLSLNAVCKNMNELMTFASLFLWRSNYDTFLETGKKIDEVIQSGREHMFFGYGVDERNDALEQQGNFHCVISGYIQNLPPVFHNEIFNRLLSQLTFMQVDEGQIEAFLRDRRSCINRVRFHFTLILNSMLTSKVSVMNVNPISMYLHSALAKYLIDNKDSIDDETVERLEEKSMNIFLPAIVKFENSFESLTTLSLQNMANGPLMWMISLECPNLWHLDVSGEPFDLALHQASKTNSGECGAVDKKGRRHKERAEFLNSLCSLYGNDNQWHEKYGKVNGCFVLKSLLLPKLKWEREEELQLIRETIQIIQKLTELEELMGVNLLNSFSTLNRLPYPPFMLKLKKFSNQPGEIFFDVEPELLRKVHLPLVTEVEFVINLPIPLTTLEIFPNMRHLSLTPYSYDSHNFNDIAKYLTNLQTLNLEVLHELSVESVCELAEHCPNLESLYLTCPSLRTALQEHACEETKNNRTEEDSQPPGTKISRKEPYANHKKHQTS